MKFFYARKTLMCRGCHTSIDRGEVCIRTFHKNRQTGVPYAFIYHYECYVQDFIERIRKSAFYWIRQQHPPKRRGRPKKYLDIKESNKLRALIHYHRKAGNEDRVNQLLSLLKGLEVKED